MLSGTLVKIIAIFFLLAVGVVLMLGMLTYSKVDQIKHQIN